MGTLSLSDGTPTSGVYGFAVIAMEIVRRLKPDKVVVAWDKAHTSTEKRTAIFKDYKAGRVKPPEDFYAQIPLLKELIAGLGWGFMEADGYEADDIIGTLALLADKKGDWETYIISSDLDMLQVVDENTKMYRVLKGFSDIEEMDVPAVEEKYGIRKDQFLDLKALKGDASDNIPGVPGVGEKTAAKLLNQYGDLDGIYAHVDEIQGRTREKLIAGKDSAYMSYQLGKIMTDAPVEMDEIPDFEIDGERILKALNKLEFSSLVRRFQAEILGSADQVEVPGEELRELPGDTVVSWDVKKLLKIDEKAREEIFNGKKYWDLEQGRFLLDPLARPLKELPDARYEYWRQREEFEKRPQLYRIFMEYDLPLIPVLYKMEQEGILIDKGYFKELEAEYTQEVETLAEKVYKLAGREFNINSPVQLSEVLFDELGLPTKGIKKTARGYSTGAKELDKLKELHPIIMRILEYREAAKLLSTYILPLPEEADENGRVHTTFTQNVTSTGRLSSVNPNLQNIPVRTEEGRRIRTGFVAAPGKVLVSADYSQFELRLAAVLAGDDKLVADFNSGVDIHTKTAAEVFGVPMEKVTKKQRRAAKVINFGVLYGMSARGLADAAGMGIYEAKQFIEDYFKVRRPIREYLDEILKQAKEKGYVETFYGRRRPTPDVKSPNFMVRAGAERAAQNMPIQGTEADLMKRAMIEMDKKLMQYEGAKMILQIHDSLIVECREELKEEIAKVLQETMEAVAPELPIKLAVEVTSGKNWGEL